MRGRVGELLRVNSRRGIGKAVKIGIVVVIIVVAITLVGIGLALTRRSLVVLTTSGAQYPLRVRQQDVVEGFLKQLGHQPQPA
jgi:hypothetical protein